MRLDRLFCSKWALWRRVLSCGLPCGTDSLSFFSFVVQKGGNPSNSSALACLGRRLGPYTEVEVYQGILLTSSGGQSGRPESNKMVSRGQNLGKYITYSNALRFYELWHSYSYVHSSQKCTVTTCRSLWLVSMGCLSFLLQVSDAGTDSWGWRQHEGISRRTQ